MIWPASTTTVGSTGAFDRDLSAGNGFIALAAVIMGRWHPVGATFAAVFFGFMWNLQNQLSFVDKLPSVERAIVVPYIRPQADVSEVRAAVLLDGAIHTSKLLSSKEFNALGRGTARTVKVLRTVTEKWC